MAALLGIVVTVAQGTAAAAAVRIGGTGLGLEIMRILASSFQEEQPRLAVTVYPSLGSAGGIKALSAGELDIALGSRALKEAEKAQGLREVALFKTPFVFVANRGVGQRSITTAELEKIYAGRLRDWSDASPVRLVLRPHTDSDTEIAMSLSPGMAAAVSEAQGRKGLILAVTDQENLEAISKVPGALGGSTLSQILTEKRSVNILALDGRQPSVEALGAGDYPLSKTLYLIVKPDLPAEARQFVDFCRSPRAAAIIKDFGGLPLTDKR